MPALQLYAPANPYAFNVMHDYAGSMEENFFKLEKVSSLTWPPIGVCFHVRLTDRHHRWIMLFLE